MYCMEDSKATILSTIHTLTPTIGRSPRNLMASTLSDELMLANKGRAFALSLKDRAAITLAGHAGTAFWFDKINGGMVTSTYYASSYPQWVQDWNKNYSPKSYTWTLQRPLSEYQNKNETIFTDDIHRFGKSFPHQITNPPSKNYFKLLSKTPKADQLIADFAIHLLNEEKLGQSVERTDYLAISFSAADAIGHQFGPNSLEAEDNLLALDKTLNQLFLAIDKTVGLHNTLIILTADHGVNDSHSHLKAHRIHEVNPVNIIKTEQFIRTILNNRYQLPSSTLLCVLPPFVYLDHQQITSHKLSISEVSQFLADELTNQEGIFRAYPLPVINSANDWLSKKVNRMAYKGRAGDIYLVQPPYQSPGASNIEDRVTHGSPWQYDSYVPLIFAHPDFKDRVISRPVFVTDIAPTLSAILTIKPPSASVGKPLTEVVDTLNKSKELDSLVKN